MDRHESLSQEIYDFSKCEGVHTFSIGRSVEDRDLWGVTFGTGPRRILMTGAIHAREWISSDLLRRLARDLVRDFPYKALTLSILPMINPDGLVFAETNEEEILHRRRKKTNAREVDLNRNFDAGWSPEVTVYEKHGISIHPGEAPFSEPETQATRGYVEQFDPEVLIDWHYRGGQIEGYGRFGRELAGVMAAINHYRIVDQMHYETPGSFGGWFLKGRDDRSAVTVEIDEYWPEDGTAIRGLLEHLDDRA